MTQRKIRKDSSMRYDRENSTQIAQDRKKLYMMMFLIVTGGSINVTVH